MKTIFDNIFHPGNIVIVSNDLSEMDNCDISEMWQTQVLGRFIGALELAIVNNSVAPSAGAAGIQELFFILDLSETQLASTINLLTL